MTIAIRCQLFLISKSPYEDDLISHISDGSVTTYTIPYRILPYQPPNTVNFYNDAMVLGDNGIVFATDNSRSVVSEPVQFAFNETNGAINWTYEQPVDQLTLFAASAGGGAVSKSTVSGVDTVLRFDASGNVTPDPWTATGIVNFGGSFWSGNSTSASTVSGYFAAPFAPSSSAFPTPVGTGANISSQDYSIQNFSQTGANQTITMGRVNEIIQALPNTAFKGTAACYSWLQTTEKGNTLSDLQLLYNQTNPQGWGHGTILQGGNVSYPTDALSINTNPDGTPVPNFPNGVATIVSDVAGFFNSNFPSGPPYQGMPYLIGPARYNGGTYQAQLAILLHELGHVAIGVPAFPADNGKPGQVQANDATVNTNCGQMIQSLPGITGISPSAGSVGGTVTITGTNFAVGQGGPTVSFNGVTATPTSWNSTSIAVSVPAGATTGNIVVTVSGVPTTGPVFTVQ